MNLPVVIASLILGKKCLQYFKTHDIKGANKRGEGQNETEMA